jgi:hypothetical protein
VLSHEKRVRGCGSGLLKELEEADGTVEIK